jgi:hypothetical protein
MTEEERKASQTKQLLNRVFSTPDGKAVLDHLQKVFVPAPTMTHQGMSEQCMLGRAEVILYLVRNSSLLTNNQ